MSHSVRDAMDGAKSKTRRPGATGQRVDREVLGCSSSAGISLSLRWSRSGFQLHTLYSRTQRLRNYDLYLIGAVTGVRLTHLVGECAGHGSKVVLRLTVVWCRLDDDVVPQDVHGPTIGRTPS